MEIEIKGKPFTLNEQQLKTVTFQKILRQMRKTNDSSLILDLFEDMFGVEQADEIYALFDDNFEDVVNFFQSEQFQKAGSSLSSQRSELPTNTNP